MGNARKAFNPLPDQGGPFCQKQQLIANYRTKFWIPLFSLKNCENLDGIILHQKCVNHSDPKNLYREYTRFICFYIYISFNVMTEHNEWKMAVLDLQTAQT